MFADAMQDFAVQTAPETSIVSANMWVGVDGRMQWPYPERDQQLPEAANTLSDPRPRTGRAVARAADAPQQ